MKKLFWLITLIVVACFLIAFLGPFGILIVGIVAPFVWFKGIAIHNDEGKSNNSSPEKKSNSAGPRVSRNKGTGVRNSRSSKSQPKHQRKPTTAPPVNWRPLYQEAKKAYKDGGEIKTFLAAVNSLVLVKPPSATIHEMLRDAAQTVAKADKTLALMYYMQARLRGCTKELNKATLQILFPEERIRFKFESILEFYRSSGDTNETKRQLLAIYEPLRRQIVIDKNDLREKEREFKETLDLLDGVLAEEEPNTVPSAVGTERLQRDNTASSHNSAERNEPEGDEIEWTEAENALLNAFDDAGGELTEEQVEDLARKYGHMPAMLIDGINEKYVEMTEHPLIEDEEGRYVIEK